MLSYRDGAGNARCQRRRRPDVAGYCSGQADVTARPGAGSALLEETSGTREGDGIQFAR